ncbi:MAG: clostripain-related cysteine peptidase [Saprospiraceae bacterium]
MYITFKNLTIVCSTLIILSSATCINPPNKKDQEKKESPSRTASITEWTVMVFMNGDNNLEPAALEDFQEMSKIGSNDRVNIIAQMDLIGKYMNVGWTQTLRFRIAQGMNPTPQNAILDLGEANMGDPKILNDFVSWSITNYPSKKYALVIWDHGQGYRLIQPNLSISKEIKAYLTNVQDSLFEHKSTSPIIQDENSFTNNIHILGGDPFRSSMLSPFRSCSNDETSNDELYNREIQDGLLSALHGKKLEILGFDACLMAMVETGYAMRNVTNNLVGSEELEPNEGWQYDDWLSKLLNNPTMDGQELSKILVDSYRTSSGNYSTNTLSAVDLTTFESVAEEISRFAISLKSKLSTELLAISKARKECAVYAPNSYAENPPKDYFYHIDFVKFCDQLIYNTHNAQLKTDAENVKSAILKIILDNYRGDLRKESFGSNGLAIYFPESNTQYKGDKFEKGGYKKTNTYYPVEFVQNHKWADFLHEYFKLVP